MSKISRTIHFDYLFFAFVSISDVPIQISSRVMFLIPVL